MSVPGENSLAIDTYPSNFGALARVRYRGTVVGLAVLTVTLGACGSASQGSNTPPVHPEQAPGAATTTTSTSTAAAPPTTAELPPQVLGPRVVTITGTVISTSSGLTIGAHPTSVPMQLQATSTVPLEVCPATINGGGVWPQSRFTSCLPFDGSGHAVLPATDGFYHVTFEVRSVGTGISTTPTVTLSYTATDSYFAIVPPAATDTRMTIAYVPGSSTTGTSVSQSGIAYTVLAPGFVLSVTQNGQTLSSSEPCDFLTEFTSCIGGVDAGQPVSVTVTGPSNETVQVGLAWR